MKLCVPIWLLVKMISCPRSIHPKAALFCPLSAAPRRERRNVILYFLESTPASVIGKRVQGKEVTPNLNRLAANSLYFARHYANFPLSINAFYNAFCSAYALPDGAWISLALPDFAVPCLSQILGSEGYRSIALHAGYLGYAKQKRFMQKRNFDEMHDAETLKKPPYEEGMGPLGGRRRTRNDSSAAGVCQSET
jgi:phosphoglycerol transferase MdoB-like AlkP superfamily enzyme